MKHTQLLVRLSALVAAASGRTLALRTGATTIVATGQRYHTVGGVAVPVVGR